MHRFFAGVVMAVVAIGVGCVGGCASLHVSGFEVRNDTDQLVKVELMDLDKTGGTRTYSTQVLSPGGTIKIGTDTDQRRAGNRARFTLVESPVSESAQRTIEGLGNEVVLGVPEKAEVRTYELQMLTGRLVARRTGIGADRTPRR